MLDKEWDSESSIVAQQHPIWMLVKILDAPFLTDLPMQLMAQELGSEGAPGSWLRFGSVWEIIAIWSMNHKMRTLFVSPPVCDSTFQINKI